ncbi:hypothetical protein FHX45_001223 [Amycolatopsis granulosa]|nr:hypothetical protein [Amycolatopsis granulosa]
MSYAIDEWLKTADIEATTRHGYLGYTTVMGSP